MAKAIRKEVTLKPIVTYTLELTEQEAETLYLITFRIGGDPEKSRRGDMDNIGKELRKFGFSTQSTEITGTIQCKTKI